MGKREDSAGLAKMFYTSTALTSLDLSDNFLGHFKQTPVGFRQVARGLSANKALTEVNLSNNHLWPEGVRAICNALRTCSSMLRVDLSYNHPGREPALADCSACTRSSSASRWSRARRRRASRSPSSSTHVARSRLAARCSTRLRRCATSSATRQGGRGTTSPQWASDQQNDAVLLAGALKTNDT